MDVRTQSALLAAIVGLALGVSVLLRAKRERSLLTYGVFAISVAVYHLARFFEGILSDSPLGARLFLGLAIVAGALIPSTALSFFLDFLNFSPRIALWGRRTSIFSLVLGLAVGATPLATVLWADVAVSVWAVLALSFSVSVLLARRRISESRIDRLRITYLAIGAAASIFTGGLDLVARLGVSVPELGAVVSTLYLFLLSQTLLKLRLMDLHELLGKIASQTVLAAALALIFLLLTAWVGDNRTLFFFNTLVAAFVVIILFEPLSGLVEEQVVALFFRQRFAFLESARQLLRRTASVIEVQELATLILDGLNETRRVTHASIYLLAEGRPGFRLLDSRGPAPTPFIEAAGARALMSRGERAQLIEAVERRAGELKAQPMEARRQRDELRRLNEVRGAMQQMRAGITVPLLGNDRILGFFNLRDERVPEAFASDEIALVLDLADRLASVVESSKLYERMRERDRLAALGEMAAGLAHEIRNPLSAIKGAAQCLDPGAVGPEEREFLEVIVEEVNRLNGVVTAFLDYARPLKQSFTPTDVNDVVSRTHRLIQNDVPANITVKEELAQALPRVDADPEQLKQVLINLVQNAQQAIGDRPGGEILVRTHRTERFGDFRAPEPVELHVVDNGPGIPPEQQVNIFVPFFTTKQKGTGLGLAICQRIVKNHGGSMAVQSRVGDGATFIVRLPALPSELPAAETPPVDGTPMPATRTLSNPSLPPAKAARRTG